MKVEKLLRYGIPESVIESWRKTQGEKLLPLQAQAVTKHDLLNGKSLIISAPTSSGKTFCGEMAAVANLFKRKKVVFLVPLKAIAEEKYSDFCQKYAQLGIKVVISTRDRQEDDREIEKGNFDLAIMIYEKFNQLLIKNLDVLSLINLIVTDELQMIADPSRGAILELALTKIKTSKYSPQIIGLSAVLKDVDQLSSWLECGLLLDKSRPVELLQGVLLEGKFHFRKYNSGEEGTDQLVEWDSEESHQILFANLEKLLEDGEQVLIFLKSKKNCEDCAFLFSEKINLPPSLGAIETLSELENTTLKEKLILCLQKGIAFHNADLTSDERKVIEHFYLKGEIRAIFSTTTLSLGINLPAKTVFIETQKFEKGEYSNKAVMLPLSWSEYENMSGRAGRFGLQRDFGRSIIIAQNKFQFDSLWEGYIEGEEEKISSQLYKKELGDVILDLIASGAGKSLSHLKQAISSSLDGELITQNEDLLKEKLKELVQEKILLKNGETFSPSRLGSLCAFKGISIHTGLSIKKKLEGPPDLDPFSWFYSVLNTKDGEEVKISVGFWEEQNRVYEKALTERYKDVPPTEQEIKNLLDEKIDFPPREIRLVKLCFLLSEWITQESTFDLEGKYFCRSGQIEQIGKRVSWLLDSACGIARVLNSDKRVVHFLKRLSLKVNFGVDDVGVKLARLRVPGLGRDYIWNLVKKGFCSLRKIKEAKLEELERVIPNKVAQRLSEIPSKAGKEKIEERSKGTKEGVTGSAKACPMDPASRGFCDFKKSFRRKFLTPISDEISLMIDGTPVKDKFLILANGRKITLPAKSFKYLVKLAWAHFKNEDGWIHKNDFEPGENQTRYLHRLKKQIMPNLVAGQSFIENNRLGCYRLNVSKDKIRINAPALLKNPDIEIKKMAEELAGWINVYEKHEVSNLR
ncbi:MAG: DEAD/DEAH box helicase [candidate division Zixibacteria bacterium]|nr:DEAD/DEAH box helicase [candidate division Zixibacteria bacterium]